MDLALSQLVRVSFVPINTKPRRYRRDARFTVDTVEAI